jgi:hypothetical protein
LALRFLYGGSRVWSYWQHFSPRREDKTTARRTIIGARAMAMAMAMATVRRCHSAAKGRRAEGPALHKQRRHARGIGRGCAFSALSPPQFANEKHAGRKPGATKANRRSHPAHFRRRGKMSRASAQTRQLTDEERSSIDATNQALLGQQSSLANTVMPAYQNELSNPGYTQAQQAAITGATQGALGGAFNSLAQSAANQVARTNNSAGFSDTLDQLARQQAQQQATSAQQNQVAFANNAQQQQAQALQGLAGLYGVDANMLSRTLGIPAELLGVRQRADGSTSVSGKVGFGPVSLGFSSSG